MITGFDVFTPVLLLHPDSPHLRRSSVSGVSGSDGKDPQPIFGGLALRVALHQNERNRVGGEHVRSNLYYKLLSRYYHGVNQSRRGSTVTARIRSDLVASVGCASVLGTDVRRVGTSGYLLGATRVIPCRRHSTPPKTTGGTGRSTVESQSGWG